MTPTAGLCLIRAPHVPFSDRSMEAYTSGIAHASYHPPDKPRPLPVQLFLKIIHLSCEDGKVTSGLFNRASVVLL